MYARKISNLIIEAMKSLCPTKVAISFSGGLDSSVLAKAARDMGFDVLLITVGMENSSDIKNSIIVAKDLGLPHEKVCPTYAEVISAYSLCQKIMPGEFLKVELMVPVYFACKKAKEKNFSHIIFGSGSEELFVGYDRYFTYLKEGVDLERILQEEIRYLPYGDCKRIDATANYFNLITIYPFLYSPLIEFVLSLPLSQRIGTKENKKPLLRESAMLLGVPDSARMRPKKAMQYGSGIHRILLKEFGKKN
ncbi:MAG: asparagine synthase C-terminal domain-containing protein [Candidatus Anstonellales archaeon]